MWSPFNKPLSGGLHASSARIGHSKATDCSINNPCCKECNSSDWPLSCCRDGHGYPCIDQGPSLGGFAKSEDGSAGEDLFSSEGDDDVELEKSNVLLLGPTGDPRCIVPTE